MTLFRHLIMALLLCANAAIAASVSPPLLLTPDDCLSAIKSAEEGHKFVAAKRINVLSWNVHKLKNYEAINEIANYSKASNILFLQEAVKNEELINSKPFSSFSVGYKTAKYSSGVLTLSDYPIVLTCGYVHFEPWLRTPKATNLVLLNVDGVFLLAANIHSINFTLNTRHFSSQLHSIQKILLAHKGPLIFSGDFNTWSDRRVNVLTDVAKTANLTQVEFKKDLRKKVFGLSLDKIFIRDVKIIKSRTKVSTASDHNPLFTTIELTPFE